MTAKILSVHGTDLSILKSNPPKLDIVSTGTVSTTGWTNPRLIPYVYVVPPIDGIYEFDFVADPPTGMVPQLLMPISAKHSWDGFPSDLRGIRVYASTDNVQTMLNSNQIEIDRSGIQNVEKVTADELGDLRNTHQFISIKSGVRLVGDVLEIPIRYVGGCQKHLFRLIWDGVIRESYPEKISLFLYHNNNNDACRAIVEDTIHFELTPPISAPKRIDIEGWRGVIDFK